MSNRNLAKGFTLVELMVAIGIFAIVALLCTNAFIAADRVNKKAEAMKTVIDNLHFALNAITFKLKQGGTYHCLNSTEIGLLGDVPNAGDYISGQDCHEGAASSAIVFRSPKSAESPKLVAYRLNSSRIEYYEQDITSEFTPITVDSLIINDLRFDVHNTSGGNDPRVFITIEGVANFGHDSSSFQLETAVAERI